MLCNAIYTCSRHKVLASKARLRVESTVHVLRSQSTSTGLVPYYSRQTTGQYDTGTVYRTSGHNDDDDDGAQVLVQ